MIDEYYESVKRRRMLDEKLTEITKNNARLPQTKIDEMHRKLKSRNTDIYIARFVDTHVIRFVHVVLDQSKSRLKDNVRNCLFGE
jgi:hypothetical protein